MSKEYRSVVPCRGSPPQQTLAVAVALHSSARSIPEGAIVAISSKAPKTAKRRAAHAPKADTRVTEAFEYFKQNTEKGLVAATPTFGVVPATTYLETDSHGDNVFCSNVSVFVSGACNVRMGLGAKASDFHANEPVVVAQDHNGHLAAFGTQSSVSEMNKCPAIVCRMGYLGTCLEKPTRDEAYVRVFVDAGLEHAIRFAMSTY